MRAILRHYSKGTHQRLFSTNIHLDIVIIKSIYILYANHIQCKPSHENPSTANHVQKGHGSHCCLGICTGNVSSVSMLFYLLDTRMESLAPEGTGDLNYIKVGSAKPGYAILNSI